MEREDDDAIGVDAASGLSLDSVVYPPLETPQQLPLYAFAAYSTQRTVAWLRCSALR